MTQAPERIELHKGPKGGWMFFDKAEKHPGVVYAEYVPDTGWQDIETIPDEMKDGRELPLWREDAGWFSGFYGTCEHLTLRQEEIDEIDEDTFFFESWWAFAQDGAIRIEDDLEPTLWFALPTPPEASD